MDNNGQTIITETEKLLNDELPDLLEQGDVLLNEMKNSGPLIKESSEERTPRANDPAAEGFGSDAKAQSQEMPLIMQAALNNIPNDGVPLGGDRHNTATASLVGLVNSEGFLEKFPNALSIKEDGVLDREEALTIASEGGHAFNNSEPMVVAPETYAQIKEGLKEIGIEPNDRLVEGLAYIETELQHIINITPTMQFNGSANPAESAIDLKIPEPDSSKPEPATITIDGMVMG